MPLKAPERESQDVTTRPAAVTVSGLSKTFAGRDGPVPALDRVSFEAATGETLGLVGPSGCGKSTLLEVVAGLEPASAGAVAVRGECVLMPQRDLLLPWRSALDNAAIAPQLQSVPRTEARRRAAVLFARFGLAEFAQARPAELSGGMRQRVAFARTLLAGRPVLLLDEPFASLDSITRAELQAWLLTALAEEPRTTLLVTHDIEEALYVCDRVLVMSRRPGTIVADLRPGLDRSPPRTEVVTSREFSRLRQDALEALA